jgi:hypothetical protein
MAEAETTITRRPSHEEEEPQHMRKKNLSRGLVVSILQGWPFPFSPKTQNPTPTTLICELYMDTSKLNKRMHVQRHGTHNIIGSFGECTHTKTWRRVVSHPGRDQHDPVGTPNKTITVLPTDHDPYKPIATR